MSLLELGPLWITRQKSQRLIPRKPKRWQDTPHHSLSLQLSSAARFRAGLRGGNDERCRRSQENICRAAGGHKVRSHSPHGQPAPLGGRAASRHGVNRVQESRQAPVISEALIWPGRQ